MDRKAQETAYIFKLGPKSLLEKGFPPFLPSSCSSSSIDRRGDSRKSKSRELIPNLFPVHPCTVSMTHERMHCHKLSCITPFCIVTRLSLATIENHATYDKLL